VHPAGHALRPDLPVSPRRSHQGLKEVIRDYRREQIIDVARRLFGERGTTEVSMDDIANEAGVARSTVYVYFSGRDELLRSCLQRMYELVHEVVDDAWGECEGPSARLQALIRGLLRVVDENQGFFRLAMATQGSADRAGPVLGAELATIGLSVAGMLTEVLSEGMARGVFRHLPVERAVKLVGQQLYGAMSVRAGDPTGASLEQDVDDVHRFVVDALRPSTAGA
jgi:AcrR family transcriptional regulator